MLDQVSSFCAKGNFMKIAAFTTHFLMTCQVSSAGSPAGWDQIQPALQGVDGRSGSKIMEFMSYPLVNIYITMENHNF
jgi:hypothetical protein